MSSKLVKTIANIIATVLIGYSSKTGKPIADLIKKEDLIELARLFESGEINNQGLQKVIEHLIENPQINALQAVEKLGVKQVNDIESLEKYVDIVIDKYPVQLEQYRSGKTNLIGFFVGKCMEESAKSGNPAKFKELLERKLN